MDFDFSFVSEFHSITQQIYYDLSQTGYITLYHHRYIRLHLKK